MNFKDYINQNLWKLRPISLESEEHKHFLWRKENNYYIPVDLKRIIRFLKSNFDICYSDKEFLRWREDFKIPYETMREQILQLRKNMKTGGIFFNPTVNSKTGIGRAVFNKKNMYAPACLSKDLRSYLFKDRLVDYDLVNAHSSIMLSICESMCIDETEYCAIKNYVENREEIIKKAIINHFGYKREEINNMNKYEYDNLRDNIKNLIIKIGYGASYKKWCHDEGLQENLVYEIQQYGLQMKTLTTEYIIPNNQDYYKKLNSDYTRNCTINNITPDYNKTHRTIASNFLQHYEMLITTSVMSLLIQQKKINPNLNSYEFDGFEVEAIDSKKFDCEYLNKKTYDITGFERLSWSVKTKIDTITPKLEICEEQKTRNINIPEEYSSYLDIEYFKQLKTSGGYYQQKKYFEYFVKFAERPQPLFYIIEELSIMNSRLNEPVKIRKINHFEEHQLKKLYGRFETDEVNSHGKPIKFLDKYLDDEDRKTYKSLSFTPYNSKYNPIQDEQYLNTFMGYNKIVFEGEKYDLSTRKKYIKPFKTMAIEVCGNEDNYNIFMNLMAQKIKYPTHKKPYAIILQSNQGEGKNLMLDCFGYVINKEHYLTTSNIQDVIGTHAEGLFHKILANLNEMDLNQTKNTENRLKSLISEDTITFNPKNVRPYEIENYAFVVLTTNGAVPILLDIISGERRWFIFEGSGKNIDRYNKKLSNGETKWSKLATYFKTKEFIKALYEELNATECETFDFVKAKRDNAKSSAYKKVASYSIPMELQFLNDFIQFNAFLHYKHEPYQNSSFNGWDNYPTIEFYEFECFNQDIKIKIDDLRRAFNSWASYNNWKTVAEERNSKAFKNKFISGLKLKCINTSTLTNNCRVFTFNPRELMIELYHKKAIDLQGDEVWLKTDINHIISQDNDDFDLEIPEIL
jgi:hypothetical protein